MGNRVGSWDHPSLGLGSWDEVEEEKMGSFLFFFFLPLFPCWIHPELALTQPMPPGNISQPKDGQPEPSSGCPHLTPVAGVGGTVILLP